MSAQRLKIRTEKLQEVELKSCLAMLRKKAHKTQRELADAVGVTESTIANWETGRRGLEWFHRVIVLCNVLNCSTEQLIEYVVQEDATDGMEQSGEHHSVTYCELMNLMDEAIGQKEISNASTLPDKDLGSFVPSSHVSLI